jgi:hypothetical protein
MNFAAETGSALKRTPAPRFNRLEPVSHFSRRFQSAGCDRFLTNDHRLDRCREIQVTALA